MTIKNAKGTVYYGMHFYPGIAGYQPAGKDPFRVFLNEDTIRSMDASFAGRPVFVSHVDGVEQNLDELKGQVDGWVVESFYNAADGKHWVKFLVVSERGERAIKRGMRLSNCYVPKAFGIGGIWNGVSYDKEVMGGEYEHLAIVPNPRYDESVILTPEQFKRYNEEKLAEVTRLANEKGKEVKIKLFKRQAVENAADLEGMSVLLPKSGKEFTVEQMVNFMDVAHLTGKDAPLANVEHCVEVDGERMTVAQLVEKYQAMKSDIPSFDNEDAEESEEHAEEREGGEVKKDKGEGAKEKTENASDDEDESVENADDEDADDGDDGDDEEAERIANEAAAKAKKAAAKAKADKVRNAHRNVEEPQVIRLELSGAKVARGKARYGS